MQDSPSLKLAVLDEHSYIRDSYYNELNGRRRNHDNTASG